MPFLTAWRWPAVEAVEELPVALRPIRAETVVVAADKPEATVRLRPMVAAVSVGLSGLAAPAA